MQANTAQCGNGSTHVADGIQIFADAHFEDGILRYIGERGDLYEWHIFNY
jgi:hypothetical protein